MREPLTHSRGKDSSESQPRLIDGDEPLMMNILDDAMTIQSATMTSVRPRTLVPLGATN